MKHFLILLVVMTVSVSSYAKKNTYPIEIVIGMADLIVTGEIESYDSDSYQFRISKTFKGELIDLVNVQMFKEWTCDTRIREIEKGQKLFLFLKKEEEKYQIINGSTGEIFIEKGRVLRIFNDSQPTESEFEKSLVDFISAYQLKTSENVTFGENIFVQLKSDNEIKNIMKTSELTAWIFDRVKVYRIKKNTSSYLQQGLNSLVLTSSPCVFGDSIEQDLMLLGKWRLIKVDNKRMRKNKNEYFLEFLKNGIVFNTTNNICKIEEWSTKHGAIEYDIEAIECTELCCDDDFSKSLHYNGKYSLKDSILLITIDAKRTLLLERY